MAVVHIHCFYLGIHHLETTYLQHLQSFWAGIHGLHGRLGSDIGSHRQIQQLPNRRAAE